MRRGGTSNIQLHTLNLILNLNLNLNKKRDVSRGSGNPAALLVAEKRQECRFHGWCGLG